jgi:N-methylhydantoinase B
MNVRVPERANGDLRAQLTAVKTGERGFLDLVRRYGADEVRDAIEEIMDVSERAARARTLSIPDGVYEAESFMDDDGIEIGKDVPIKVKVIVKGDRMTIDLTEVSRQVRGFYNSGRTTAFGCSQVAYKCITSPTDYPVNDGSFRSLEVIIPPGRIVSATRPAPMRWWMTFPMTVIDTVIKALAPAIPDRVAAGHHADLILASMYGVRDGKFIYAGISHVGGGWGAKMREDGINCTIAMNDGDTHNGPVEMMETKSPIIFDSYRLVPDSGGPGKFRGGVGAERIVRPRIPLSLTTHMDRTRCAPWGLEGGQAGFPNRVSLVIDGVLKDDLPNAKIMNRPMRPVDKLIARGGGGGGFGPPIERPIDKVRHDVRQGYVTAAAARTYYGVVIDPVTFAVDLAATEKLRAAMAHPSRRPPSAASSG